MGKRNLVQRVIKSWGLMNAALNFKLCFDEASISAVFYPLAFCFSGTDEKARY